MEKLHAQTSWGDREDQNTDYYQELYVGDASLQRYGPSNRVWLWLEIKENHWNILKKVVFDTNLEQLFKRMATDLDKQLTMMQQRLMCALKNARLLLPQQYGQ